MILLHNLYFFNKHGNSLSQTTELKISVVVKDPSGKNAEIIAITDRTGRLLGCKIVNGGYDYVSPEITITDKETNASYKITSNQIELENGKFKKINMQANPIGFSFPYLTFSASLFFKDVPEQLIESEHVFVLEKAKDLLGNEIFIRPRGNADDVLKITKINGDDEIYIYDVNYNHEFPIIEKTDDSSETFDDDSLDDITEDFFRKIEAPITIDSMQFNIAATGVLDFIFDATFSIGINDETFFTITGRSESVMEDERFTKQLENLGISISKQEELIFRDSDINEELPNYALLNYKRKEMLLENHNIFPYIGSYKAIVNILKFFGYSDMRIKEYWLNTLFNNDNKEKWKQIEIPMLLNERDKTITPEKLIPEESYKKTSFFGIYYDINKTNGTVDEFGIPNVEDAFEFTIEEILIKLSALRTFLKEKFLPLNAKIIDITGEGIYFERFSLRSWSDYVQRFDVTFSSEFDFIIHQNDHFIVDVKDYKNTLDPIVLDQSALLFELYGSNAGNYLESDKYNDTGVTPVGCVIDLSVVPFELSWNDMVMSWDDLVFNGITPYSNAWDNIADGDFYEIEWRVSFERPEHFTEHFRGTIKQFKDLRLILPFAGKYQITLVMHDLRNFEITKTHEILVRQFNPEIIAFGSFSKFFNVWDDVKNKSWKDLGGTFVSPTIRHDNKLSDIDISWDTLSLTKFLNSENIVKKQNANSLQYVMEQNIKEGKLLWVNENSGGTDIIYETFIQDNELSPGDYIYFKLGTSIMQYKIDGILYNDNVVTLHFIEKIKIHTGWTILREIKNAIIIKNSNVENTLAIDDFIIFENDTPEDIIYNVDISQSDPQKEIKLTQQIEQLHGDKYLIFKDSGSILIELFKNTNETIVSQSPGGPITDTHEIYPRWHDRWYMEFDFSGYGIVEGISEGVLTQGTIKQRIRFLEIIDNAVLLEWIDGSPNQFDLNMPIYLSFEYFHSMLKAQISTDETSNLISPATFAFTMNPEFIKEHYDMAGNLINNDGMWRIKRIHVSSKFSAKLKNRFTQDDNLLLFLDGEIGNLLVLERSFNFSWSSFDIDEAIEHFKVENRNWSNFKNLSWDDLNYHSWSDFSIVNGILPGFRIASVAPGGKIQFNEESEFQFETISGGMTHEEQIDAAVIELNTTHNLGLKRFEFKKVEVETGVFMIDATAEHYSIYNLGYLKFSDGVESIFNDTSLSHSYPIGDKFKLLEENAFGDMNSIDRNNAITSTYFSRGTDTLGEKGWFPQYDMPSFILASTDKWKTYPINYTNAISPNISWDNLNSSTEHFIIPLGTTVYFVDDNSGIPGKLLRNWKLEHNGKILIKTEKDFLIWFFDKEGEYSLSYKIIDSNGNTSSLKQSQMIIVKKEIDNE